MFLSFRAFWKKNERFSVFRCFTDVFDCFLKPSSKWRFYVIFRIVKKQLGFVGKSRTSSDEVEKWIWELEKKGTFFGADFACSRITYYKYWKTGKGSTNHVMCRFVGGEALSRAEPPAGPPKFDLLVADGTFPEISVIFRHHARTFPPWQLFLKRIDEHNDYIPG